MHIMPSDANCITTTNNVHTDSIYYENKTKYFRLRLKDEAERERERELKKT